MAIGAQQYNSLPIIKFNVAELIVETYKKSSLLGAFLLK
jgi:hypothetical protein